MTDAAPPAEGRPKTILVAEDSQLSAVILEKQLTGAGYRVVTVGDGQQALDRLQAPDAGVDLLISDVMMPVLDGFELVRRLRLDERFRQLPIVMLTALDRVEDKVRALKAGADFYVYKPYDIDDLLGVVADLLAKRASFKLKVVGDNWYEFHLTNSDIFIREVNDIIRAVGSAGENLAANVEAIIQVINVIRATLIDPLQSAGTLNLVFSYAYNRKNLVLKVEGFADGYLQQHGPLLDELRRLAEHVKVNRYHNKLLVAKEISAARAPEPAVPTADLAAIEETLADLESKLVEIKGVTTKSTGPKAGWPEPAAVVPPAGAAPAAGDGAAPAAAAGDPKTGATFAFKSGNAGILFVYTPHGAGGAPVAFDRVAAHIREQHLVKINTAQIRDILKANLAAERNVGPRQYQKNWDGQVEVAVAPDRMSVSLTIHPPANPKGKKVSFEYARDVIDLYQFDKFDDTQLKTVFGRPKPEGTHPIFAGTPPQAGTDARFKYSLFATGSTVPVRRGQLLLFREPPTVGKAGIDVFGKLVPPTPGKDVAVAADAGVLIDKRKRRWFAAVDGTAAFVDGALTVTPAPGAEPRELAEIARFLVVPLTAAIEKPTAYAAELLDLKETRLNVFTVSRGGRDVGMAFEAVQVFKVPSPDGAKAAAIRYFNLREARGITLKTIVEGKRGMLGLGAQDWTIEATVDFRDLHEVRLLELRGEILKNKTSFQELRARYGALADQFQRAADPGERDRLQAELATAKERLLTVANRVKTIEQEMANLTT